MSVGPALSVIIPAFDVEPHIAAVLRGVRAAAGHAHVVVVDDGSRDSTAAIAGPLADVVVRHARNRGKGAALRTGIACALEREVAIVVTLDADGQHAPEAIPALVDAMTDADIVIGTRARAGAMPLQRRMSNALSSAVVSRLAGTPVADSQSGFRAIRADVLRAVAPSGERYDLETDLLVRAARRGFRITAVPVPTVYGAPSHFRPMRDTLLLVRTMLRLGFAPSR